MNLFFWKNNKLIDTFANEVASELYSNLQPQLVKNFFEKKSFGKKLNKDDKKLLAEMQTVIKKVDEFKYIHSLGVYGKARLHLKFKIRLEELGYEKKIVDMLNEIVMLRTN